MNDKDKKQEIDWQQVAVALMQMPNHPIASASKEDIQKLIDALKKDEKK